MVLNQTPYPLECKNATVEIINREPITVEIVYVDSYTFLGHYILGTKRIELSRYLADFPELHQFVLEHEKKHVGSNLFEDLWLDIKHTIILETDTELHKQLKAFRRLGLPVERLKRLHLAGYGFLLPFALMFVGLPWYIYKQLKRLFGRPQH